MKNTIVSAILLGAVIALMIANGIFINRRANEMLTYTAVMENGSGSHQKREALDSFDSLWQKNRKLFAVCIPYHKIQLIDSHLTRVKAFSGQTDSSEYLAAVCALRDALTAARDDEQFSIQNII